MKKTYLLALFLIVLSVCPISAGEKEASDLPFVLDDIRVTEKQIEVSPLKTEIFMENYNIAGQPANVLDILKDRASIDFRGQSDLVPESDTIQMRGFDSRQFAVSVDGLVIQKTGGYWGSHYIDYGTIPFSIVDSIEIISGPHSALYDGKSFGGIINFKTKAPKSYDAPAFSGEVTANLRSYNTHSQNVQGEGGMKNFSLGVSYERSHTDGYLRNNEADMETVVGRMAYKFPTGGYARLTGSYSYLEREIPCANDPSRADYDGSYPKVKEGDVPVRWRNPNDDSQRDYWGDTTRFDLNLPSEFGEFSLGVYYTDEKQNYHRNGFDYGRFTTNYVSYGGVFKHEIDLFDNHTLTTGIDTVRLYRRFTDKIVNTSAGFIQDRWTIMPELSWTLGLRYEDTSIWWSNWWDPSKSRPDGGFKDPSIPEKSVKRNYNQLVPKSFLTYQMDKMAPWLRDTSISLGISKIWTPRGYCEVCSSGSGIELEPTRGVGYDLVLTRRLFKNIGLSIDFSHYEFKEFPIWANAATDYFKNSIWGRRMLGLEKVHKEGVDVELNGSLMEALDFYISYSFNEWKYKGPHNGGPEEWADLDLSDRAKHRLNAGLRYQLFEKTLLMLDYKFQDDQVQQIIEIVDDDPSDLYVREAVLDSYHVFDFAVDQQLFENWNNIKKGTLKVYVNNLLDEEYSNSRGFPMTDRTIGAALTFKF